VAMRRADGRSKRNRNAQSIVLTGVKALSICTKATAGDTAQCVRQQKAGVLEVAGVAGDGDTAHNQLLLLLLLMPSPATHK
jgi:hypothetical protein